MDGKQKCSSSLVVRRVCLGYNENIRPLNPLVGRQSGGGGGQWREREEGEREIIDLGGGPAVVRLPTCSGRAPHSLPTLTFITLLALPNWGNAPVRNLVYKWFLNGHM